MPWTKWEPDIALYAAGGILEDPMNANTGLLFILAIALAMLILPDNTVVFFLNRGQSVEDSAVFGAVTTISIIVGLGFGAGWCFTRDE